MNQTDYFSYFDNSPIGLWKTRADDGGFVMANQSCARILGFDSAEDLMKLKSFDLYVGSNRERLLQEIRSNGTVHDYELQLARPDGTVIWIAITARLGDDCIEGSLEDITVRKAKDIHLESCYISETKRLDELQQGIKKRIRDISLSIISDRHNF